jgi:hypothetical protein
MGPETALCPSGASLLSGTASFEQISQQFLVAHLPDSPENVRFYGVILALNL